MAPKTSNLAILFADISGSTRLYETLGDATARHVVAESLGIISDVVQRHNGVVIKTIGDEIMATFPSAEEAAVAACEMHEMLEDEFTSPRAKQRVNVSIRIGMHYGPAILESGDVFGDAVNVAARMAALAKANQTLTTQATVDLFSPVLRASTRFIDRAPVKGKQEMMDICEIIWQQEDVTRMSTGVLESDEQPVARLQLRYHEMALEVSDSRHTVVLGRSAGCDITVNEKLASRQHVRVEWRRGRFFVIDQSTNGTYVKAVNGQQSYLRREEMPLLGDSGMISLGRSFDEDPQEVVHFAQLL